MDNWADRSTHVCETCMWYVPKTVERHETIDLDGELVPTLRRVDLDRGRCRRHAPTMGGFPVVYNSDFCGDHKLR